MVATTSIYDDTVNLLKGLDAKQLMAVHSIIVELAEKNDKWSSPLGITTDEQLWDHIDHSLEQAKAGKGRNAEEVINDLKREFSA